MLALIFSSFLNFFFFLTFGIFITKIVKIPADFTEKLFIGLVASNTLTTCLSLFFPINYYTLLLFVATSSFLCFFLRKEIKEAIILIHKKENILFSALPFLVVAVMISLNPPMNYDTGLYHLQSIKWIEKFSVVPGLANLHGRFGFNPNIFTFAALTSLAGLFHQEIFSVNFTIFTILVLYFINKLYTIFIRQGITNLFVFEVIIFIAILDLSDDLTSPAPDFLSTALVLFVLQNVLHLPDRKKNSDLRSYLSILILAVYALTVKLAAMPVLVLAVFIVIKYKSEIRKLIWIIPLLAVIVLPWLVRNVILSGWLIFPFPLIDWFNFDWKVPISEVTSIRESVTGWARSPDEQCIETAEMTLYNWFPSWWNRLMIINKLFFIASLFFPVAAFVGHLIKKIKLDFNVIAIILTSLLGVIFWFILAPDIRFGKSFIIIAASSPLLYLKFNIYRKPGIRPILVFSLIPIMLLGYFVVNNTGYISQLIADKDSNRLITPQVIPTPSEVHFKTYQISGIKIYAPITGDQCSDHQIPCTDCPPDNTLMLRNGNLQSGFKHMMKNSKPSNK